MCTLDCWHLPRYLAAESGTTKVVGLGTTISWPGWKQNEISVKVDWHDSKEHRVQERLCITVPLLVNSKLLLLFTWTGWELPGCTCTDPVIREYPFLRGWCLKGGGREIVYVYVKKWNGPPCFNKSNSFQCSSCQRKLVNGSPSNKCDQSFSFLKSCVFLAYATDLHWEFTKNYLD